ncbi:MAG: PEP/pyruvate-binding domain-containing protein, partial [Acidobacteriota bacterium]
GVQAIIVVEDEIPFYSGLLPQIYHEVTTQTTRLMAEGINLSHRLLRIRARPKILLAQCEEEAWHFYERYADNVLGIISDIGFPCEGTIDPEAGLRLARKARSIDPHLPILLQSVETRFEEQAQDMGVAFFHKKSPHLLEGIRQFILDHFGFGDFIFRLPDGNEVARVEDIRGMIRLLPTVPGESLLFHAGLNHFSAWLKARTEFELARLLRPMQVSEFAGSEELRQFLITAFTLYHRQIRSHVTTDFEEGRFDEFVAFAKVGSGSLGGKGRGLAFMHKLLAYDEVRASGVRVAIPQTVALATDIFETFIEENALRSIVQEASDLEDRAVLDRFRASRFEPGVRTALAQFLEVVHEPLAIRSSSLLEDSLFQPFAGVYATIMLPNNHPSLDVRLAQVLEAVKVIYASTYFRTARDYLDSTPYRSEEERMAVLVQRLVGKRFGSRFYPTFSGTAASNNFYPFGSMNPEDGVAQVALGLGKTVVEGFEALRFSPVHPKVLPQMSTVKDILRNAQRRFYALDMSKDDTIPGLQTEANLLHLETIAAVADGAARPILSTYHRENDAISPGFDQGGAPLVTFEPILRGRPFDLPDLLGRLLRLGEKGIGSPAEMEFAVQLESGLDSEQVFHVVQMRPLVVESFHDDVHLSAEEMERAVVQTKVALGHGRRESLADVIVVDPRGFERGMTVDAATIVEQLNRRLRDEGRHCVLIGPGRWGSRDPWLGIPVTWPQISTARAIVETDFSDLQVEPSFGSHFFHNLTCFGVAFFGVHQTEKHASIRWPWFREHEALSEELDGAIRHLRFEEPLQVLVDGESGTGVILPPSSS